MSRYGYCSFCAYNCFKYISKVIMEIKVGETVSVDGEIREVLSLKRNNDKKITVSWTSNRQCGVCATSLWAEWKAGVDQRRRR